MIRKYKKEYKLYLKNKEPSNKSLYTFDIGLAILRPILSFFVVTTHCYNSALAKGGWKQLVKKTDRFFFHVRIFFIMSFYFSYKTLVSLNTKKYLDRFQRLCIPYFLWPVLYFLINKLLNKFLDTKVNIAFKDIKIQLMEGYHFMFPLWYQMNLIIITIFFILVIFLFKKHYNFIFILFGITGFLYQYNRKNSKYFSKYSFEIQLNYGRLVEMIPFSVIGFLISSSKIMNFFKQHRLKTTISCQYIIYLTLNYPVFYNLNGYRYSGFKFYIVSICIFIAFTMFQSEKIKNQLIIKIIKQITNYTAGIYYILIIVFGYLKNYVLIIKNKNLKGCLIIYLISYCISFIGLLFFGKTKLKHLFI